MCPARDSKELVGFFLAVGCGLRRAAEAGREGFLACGRFVYALGSRPGPGPAVYGAQGEPATAFSSRFSPMKHAAGRVSPSP